MMERRSRSLTPAALALAMAMASIALPVAAAVDCPVTIPNGSPFPPGGGSFTDFEGDTPPTHGNGHLWVGYLSTDGAIVVGKDDVERDGSISLKFPWARRIVETVMVEGALTGTFAGELEIDVQPLHGPAPPARVRTNPQGVHVGSDIRFPTTGCWEVTGRAGTDSLTFVFLLLVEGQPLPSTATDAPDLPFSALGVMFLAAGLATAVASRRSAPTPRPGSVRGPPGG